MRMRGAGACANSVPLGFLVRTLCVQRPEAQVKGNRQTRVRKVPAARASACRRTLPCSSAGRRRPRVFPHGPPRRFARGHPLLRLRRVAALPLLVPASPGCSRRSAFSRLRLEKSSLLAPQKRVPASEKPLGGRASPPTPNRRPWGRLFRATASRPHAAREAVGLHGISVRAPWLFASTTRQKIRCARRASRSRSCRFFVGRGAKSGRWGGHPPSTKSRMKPRDFEAAGLGYGGVDGGGMEVSPTSVLLHALAASRPTHSAGLGRLAGAGCQSPRRSVLLRTPCASRPTCCAGLAASGYRISEACQVWKLTQHPPGFGCPGAVPGVGFSATDTTVFGSHVNLNS